MMDSVSRSSGSGSGGGGALEMTATTSRDHHQADDPEGGDPNESFTDEPLDNCCNDEDEEGPDVSSRRSSRRGVHQQQGDDIGSGQFLRLTPSTAVQPGMVVVAALTIMSIIALSLGFGLSTNNNRQQQQQQQQQEPQQTMFQTNQEAFDGFEKQLRKKRPDTLSKIQQDPNSAQAKAFRWLGSDPNLLDYSQWRLEQRFALAALYYALNGPNWPNQWQDSWLSYEVSECTWEKSISRYHNQDLAEEGVAASSIVHGDYEACGANLERMRTEGDKKMDEYHRLILSGIETLQGSVPPEISLLTALKEIELTEIITNNNNNNNNNNDDDNNKMTLEDLLPFEELSKLSQLVRIDLTNNKKLYGSLPTQLGLLSSTLQELHITGTNIGGTLPTQLAKLSKLRTLGLFGNSITGTLPPQFAKLNRSLESLWLYDNQITGTLPSQWSALGGSRSIMDSILLKNNRLTGTLPREWKELKGLLELRLSRNQFRGTIPEEYGTFMTKINFFGIQANPQVYGTIPKQWCQRFQAEELFFWLDCKYITCCNETTLHQQPQDSNAWEEAAGGRQRTRI